MRKTTVFCCHLLKDLSEMASKCHSSDALILISQGKTMVFGINLLDSQQLIGKMDGNNLTFHMLHLNKSVKL